MEQVIDLSRFISAHKHTYNDALSEIRNGKKKTHWMWFIFPQIAGLGRSFTAQYYEINSPEEAKAFLNDRYLGGNLIEISSALMRLETNDPTRVFGKPDDMKLRSCMTLFASVYEDGSVFHQVIDKYFSGVPDHRTIEILDSGIFQN